MGTKSIFNISSSYSSTAFLGDRSAVCASYISSDGWVKWRGKTASSPCNYQTLISFLHVWLRPTKQQKSMSYQTNTVRSLIKEKNLPLVSHRNTAVCFRSACLILVHGKYFHRSLCAARIEYLTYKIPFFFSPLKSNSRYVQNPKALTDNIVDLI